ncbi:MAG: methionine gamma-lyase family protein [Bacillota bacterium]|nr:methionine gamma-lyase family protein [Bacillota bacterium]
MMYYSFSAKTMEIAAIAEKAAKERFEKIESICFYNQAKVLSAFAENRIGAAHLMGTTGYGYDDIGRDALDRVYARAFECEDALVRSAMSSGTHAITTALFAVLRPGDKLLAVTGKPYDTLEDVIGLNSANNGSLKDFGIKYNQIDLADGHADIESVKSYLEKEKVKMVHIQRSRGYEWNHNLSLLEIAKLIKAVKEVSPDTICFVDNCYGEFVDEHEPTYYGADLIAGSLIKNPGGGLAKMGGYIAGRHDLVEQAGYRITTPATGRETGATLYENKDMYQGFFLAPHVVSQCMKSAVFCAALMEQLGFQTSPTSKEERTDIVQAVKFNDPLKLIAFCRGIQKGAPIDSHVIPEPWDMPGYKDPVIMAAGAFIQGASIELSADGPIREPYVGYMQGGLTYESAKIGILHAAENLLNI